ncbi:hypothetical protein Cgig2_006574 [Carnegiea gigantea]|uniref:Uncharacterized protein n=1 Tax=Carnegiea gigantea TaxID=171969 RepID=A0A9Q1JMY6_9CARY|nr:hypothetical protein Cgig2_006574 [Carnegiea gigantea]
MAVMKPDLLLKQYHPKFPISLGALWTVYTRLNAHAEQDLFNHRMKRKSETIVKSQAINSYAFCGRLIHCGIRVEDRESARPFLLSTDFPEVDDPSRDEELVDAPSEDELLDELSKVELEEAPLSYGDLPGICHLHLWAEDTRVGGVLAVGPRGSARFKKRHRIGNLFRFPTFILSGDAGHHLAIDKGQEARELRVPALHLGAGQPLKNVST